MHTDYERLVLAVHEEIRLLRKWADESERGGWSTHQVRPMRERANALALILCGVDHAPPPDADGTSGDARKETDRG